MAQKLTNMKIDRVSLVDKGANQRHFAILKRAYAGPLATLDDGAQAIGQTWIEGIAKGVADLLRIPLAKAATKTEDGKEFPAGDYAYVPDAEKPSTWKLRLTSTPGGEPDPGIVGAAIAALGKGFRGNKVQIPADDLPKVKAKVRAAWKKAHPDMEMSDMPDVIAKAATRTFADMQASQELNAELPEAFATLQDAIWSAMWAYDDNGQPLPIEQRKAIVATDLEQFGAYALALLDKGLAKRDGTDRSPGQDLVEGLVAKVGRKISAARLTRLKEAASALTDVLNQVEASDDAATEKRADAQEVDMTAEELQAAIAKGLEPLVSRIDKLEKAAAAPVAKEDPAPDPAPAPDPVPEPAPGVSQGAVVEAIGKLADRIEKLEHTPGQPTAIAGQDGKVKKSSGWGPVFGIEH